MRIRVLVAVAICLVAVAAIGPAQYADEPLLTLYGQVHVARSLDGLSTAITVDVVSIDRPSDGLVEHAFRVQHKLSGPLAYDGLATVIFREHSLIISVDDEHGWIFTLDSRTPPPDPSAPEYTCQLAYGLSHFWGDTSTAAPTTSARVFFDVRARPTIAIRPARTAPMGVAGCRPARSRATSPSSAPRSARTGSSPAANARRNAGAVQ